MLDELNELKARVAALEKELLSGSAVPLDNKTTANARPAEPEQPSQPAPSAQSAPPAKAEPFAFADWTWLTGNARTTESPLDTKVFTGEVRVDTDYVYDLNHPRDHTIG